MVTLMLWRKVNFSQLGYVFIMIIPLVFNKKGMTGTPYASFYINGYIGRILRLDQGMFE